MSIRFVFLAVTVTALATAAGVASAGNKTGQACYKGNWQSLYTTSGGAFASEEDCTSYVAGGGTLVTGRVVLTADTYACGANTCWGKASYPSFGAGLSIDIWHDGIGHVTGLLSTVPAPASLSLNLPCNQNPSWTSIYMPWHSYAPGSTTPVDITSNVIATAPC
jgi:hypothetical protein